MSYASALKSGVAGGNSTRPRPIARPAPIAPPATSQGAGDPVKNAGPFGTLLPAAIIKIAVYAGPSGLCNLGVCSKFLRDQLLNTAVWNRVQDQLPANPKVGVSIKYDVPANVELSGGESEPEVKDGDVKSVAVSYFEREANRSALITTWNAIVSETQATRKVTLLPTSPSRSDGQGTLEYVVGGGVVIDIITPSSEPARFLTGASVADVPVWFDAANGLLQGVSPQKLKLSSGEVTLTRIGRGGAWVKIQSGGESEQFDLSDFTLSVRAAGKQYLPIVRRIVSAIKSVHKSEDETEAAAQAERVTSLVALLQENRIDRALNGIKQVVESNSIHDATFQAAFAKKRAQKARSQAQANVEYENMFEFVMRNLPSDYAQVKDEAARLNEKAKQDEEDRERRFQEKRAARIAEKDAKASDAAVSAGAAAEAAKKKKTQKKVKVKTVDKDGFVTEQISVVSEGKKKKKTKGVPQSAKILKVSTNTSDRLLAENPFNPTLHADTVISQKEEQMIKVAKKGKAVLQNRGLGKSGSQTHNKEQKMPKNTASQKKKEKKEKKKRYEEAMRAQQASQVAVVESDNSKALVMGLGAVVVLGALYYFGILA